MYKSPAYSSRITCEPQAVLREMGLELSADVKLRVWDTSAEARYMMLPLRPAGMEQMREAELAALVTNETMVGVALPMGGKQR